MPTTITRRLEWDSAHRVLGHEGKCRFLHGHRYAAEITVGTVNSDHLDTLSRVIDFSFLKEKVGGWIDKWWDHNTLLNPSDPIRYSGIFNEGKQPYVMGPGENPTAEIIALHLYNMTCENLPVDLYCHNVRVYETPNSYADYSPLPK